MHPSFPNVTFSKRRCKLCSADVPAPDFGEHIFTHPDFEVTQWPGGPLGLFDDLHESVLRSAEEAEGEPDVHQQLLMAAEVIEATKKAFIKGTRL